MSILGALVGDAAGATLEFYRNGDITESVARNAMHMPGGGVHLVGKGQVTDDGELTITLYKALRAGGSIYNLAMAYAQWYDSLPFDIGNTCASAFLACKAYVHGQIPNHGTDKLLDIIHKNNSASESNGALMRASAIPAYVYETEGTLHRALELARLDAMLSHPNPICVEINVLYVHAAYLLLHKQYDTSMTYRYISLINDIEVRHKILQWFTDSSDLDSLDTRHNIGHIKHAFILCMYFLRHRNLNYEQAILTTVMKGGDTDTNAAIVGGLVGIYSHIPQYMSTPVLQYDCTKEGNKRPVAYSVGRVLRSLL